MRKLIAAALVLMSTAAFAATVERPDYLNDKESYACENEQLADQLKVLYSSVITGKTEKECAMSTDYRLLRKVPACDLFDGRLEELGVREHVKPGATTERLLTDGRNYLWVYIDDDGFSATHKKRR